MNSPRTLVSCFVVLAAILCQAPHARAQCCPGYSVAKVCANAGLTKSRWCIEDTVPNAQSALPMEFCAYGDKVISTLEQVFNISAPDVFEYELDAQTGGAHTGTACNHLGDGVAYDAFKGNAYDVQSFWGYLLSLHEAINVWTGMSSPGWPTDFWADHQSAFPNLMDFRIMQTLGMANADNNLLKASVAQRKRFYPKGDSDDPKVVALDNVFDAMPNGDGYAGFSNTFAMQSGDGVKWDKLGVPNPDVKRTEYVVAYMSLAAQQRVLPILQGPGKNGGGEICNNTPDGTPSDKPYTCDSDRIDAIATAHCSIAANGMPMNDLSALRGGNYAAVPSGPCGAKCPSECACDAQNHCVARWLGEPADVDAGSAGAGGTTGTSGAAGTSGAPGTSGAAGTSAGNGSAGSGSAGSTGADAGNAGTGSVDGGAAAPASNGSGCGCGVIGTQPPRAFAGLGLLCVGAFACSRRRGRKRIRARRHHV